MATNRAWGDEDDDDELPAKTESKLDDNGIKTIVEYGFNTLGQKVKYTKQIKVVTRVERIPKRRIERLARLRGHRFGDATDKSDDSNVTITDYNEVSRRRQFVGSKWALQTLTHHACHIQVKIDDPKNSDKQEEVPGGVTAVRACFEWIRDGGLACDSGRDAAPMADAARVSLSAFHNPSARKLALARVRASRARAPPPPRHDLRRLPLGARGSAAASSRRQRCCLCFAFSRR